MSSFLPLTAPYGFCPKCGSKLVYNPRMEYVECFNSSCDFSRPFNAQDKANVNLQYEKEVRDAFFWDEYYKSLERAQAQFDIDCADDIPNGLNDKMKIKNIFQ